MFLENFFSVFSQFDEFLWSYLSLPVILLVGLYLSIRFRCIQLRQAREIWKTFVELSTKKQTATERGVGPLQAFFTSIGGCIGIGNVVAVCTAVQIGGPGAVFWMWVAAFLGMLIKYAEVYLGVRYRIANDAGSYDGGPMYYLAKLRGSGRWLPGLVCVLLALYGTEVYMFRVVTDSVVQNWGWNRPLVVILLLALIVGTARGGVSRVGKVCGFIIPFFIVIYVALTFALFWRRLDTLIPTIQLIFSSAFNPMSAISGGAAGSLLVTIYQGMARGCYSGDIGIGYAAVANAESSLGDPAKQARLTILGVFLDTFVVCTATCLIVISTGVYSDGSLEASSLVQHALDREFGYMRWFMPGFLFLLGYSSMIAFFVVGLKCAHFLSPCYGRRVYTFYAISSFVFFSFFDQSKALTLMSVAGALLLVINAYGIFRLRDKIRV